MACAAALLLLFDPVFTNLSSHALLDLGQSAFAFAYVLSHVVFPQSIIVQGILLGAFAASKFWAPALLFVAIVALYRFLRKELVVKNFVLHVAVAVTIFSLIYARTFIERIPFNIIFFQLKIVKYWFHHSVSSVPGDAIGLFMTGNFHQWWQYNALSRSPEWTILWPATIIAAMVVLTIRLRKKSHTLTPPFFYAVIPPIYLLYIAIQAPYTRYFIMILPYCYIILIYVISQFIKGKRHI